MLVPWLRFGSASRSAQMGPGGRAIDASSGLLPGSARARGRNNAGTRAAFPSWAEPLVLGFGTVSRGTVQLQLELLGWNPGASFSDRARPARCCSAHTLTKQVWQARVLHLPKATMGVRPAFFTVFLLYFKGCANPGHRMFSVRQLFRCVFVRKVSFTAKSEPVLIRVMFILEQVRMETWKLPCTGTIAPSVQADPAFSESFLESCNY